MEIDVSPGLGVLSVLRYLDYRPWFALAEFVDNSIESFNTHRDRMGEKLTVEIDIQTDSITIKDDAAGIFEDEYERAFRTASPPPSTQGLSEFGMGMKSAACWFGSRFQVRSTAIGEDVVRDVNFDIQSIIDSQTPLITVDIQPVNDSRSHGTQVTLLDLHSEIRGRTIGKIKDHLGSIYRRFIRGGELRLRFKSGSGNFQDLAYTEPEIRVTRPSAASVTKSEGLLDASIPIRWRKDIAFDFGDGQQVTGFAALRERGTSMGQSGFALLRRGRLIEGSDDEAWSPYGAATTGLSQRVFGELELTGFDVSHTKTGFRWEDQDDEDSFIDLLRESLDSKEMPLETEATKGRWQRTDKRELENRAKAAEEATRTTAEELGSSGTVALDPNRTPPPTDHPGGQEEAPAPDTLVEAAHSFLISLDDGEQWEIEVKSKEDPLESRSTWYRFEEIDEESTPKRATCTMLLDNPFSLRWLTDQQRQHPLVRIVAALAIAELKFRNHRQVDQLRRDFNSLLTHSLSG